jgi:O-acetylserine/cysteine efflux transporter
VLGRHGAPELRIQHLVGVAITLGAPISWGFYNSIIRRYAPRFGALRTTALAVTLGALPLLLTVDGELVQGARTGGLELAGAFLFLGLVCTVYGFTAWAKVLKRFEASRAGVFIYLVPLIASVGSHLLLDEPIDLPLIAGGGLVLGGVALATGRLRLPRRPQGG